MNRFNSAFQELNFLQSRLKGAANRLWTLQSSLATAFTQGLKESDFLPRRLINLKREEQYRFEKLIDQLNDVVTSYFNRHFIAFSSAEDVQTVMNIRKTIQYIKNAYSSEPVLIHTLARLNTIFQTPPPLTQD
jgi:hypothetical protein